MTLAVGLQQYLILSAILFSLGVYAVLTRRNAVGVLLGIELILNAANVNFVAFSRYTTSEITGQMAAIFIIILAAAEAAVALAILLGIYRNYQTINVDEPRMMKG